MNTADPVNGQHTQVNRERILLVLLPYWTPLIPPLGISCLKTFLQKYDFDVETIDLNIEPVFQDIYKKYFDYMKKCIPDQMKGNFYNVGNDVFRDQLMAHINHTDREEYFELVRQLIYKNFFVSIGDDEVIPLTERVDEFYRVLEAHIMKIVEEKKPTVLGLSVFNGNFAPSLFVFKRTKEKYPHIKTVMGGGVFCNQLEVGSPNFEYFLRRTPYIDKIIVGEGELLFLKLLRGELPGSQRVYTLKDINYRVLDLSGMGLLDFSDFNIEFYPTLGSYASRSCPFQCSFCSETTYWGKYRKREIHQVAAELRHLHREYGRQLFLLGDSLLNPFISELADELFALDIPLYWDGYLRASESVSNPEKTFKWRRGGFYRARMGLESGSPRILSIMGKKINPALIKKSLTALVEAGIKTTTYWLVGHPGETEEDFQQTLDLIAQLKDNIYEAECNPFRFYPSGQVKSMDWAKENKVTSLYPETTTKMLIARTLVIEGQPERREIYRRVRRFIQHCQSLGVPNPYSLDEINRADERWIKLHKNAVPPLLEFKQGDRYLKECRDIKRFYAARNDYEIEGDWNF